jgi:hypothetical protein
MILHICFPANDLVNPMLETPTLINFMLALNIFSTSHLHAECTKARNQISIFFSTNSSQNQRKDQWHLM